MADLTLEVAQQVLNTKSPLWIQDLNLRIERLEADGVRLRLPRDERIARWGGAICGQALMAVVDTAMVFAVAMRAGDFVDMSTVSQTTSFFRGAVGGDVLCDVSVLRMGRSLAFGEAVLATSDRPDDLVAKASLTFALSQPK